MLPLFSGCSKSIFLDAILHQDECTSEVELESGLIPDVLDEEDGDVLEILRKLTLNCIVVDNMSNGVSSLSMHSVGCVVQYVGTLQNLCSYLFRKWLCTVEDR
jgi:hypothetical protein